MFDFFQKANCSVCRLLILPIFQSGFDFAIPRAGSTGVPPVSGLPTPRRKRRAVEKSNRSLRDYSPHPSTFFVRYFTDFPPLPSIPGKKTRIRQGSRFFAGNRPRRAICGSMAACGGVLLEGASFSSREFLKIFGVVSLCRKTPYDENRQNFLEKSRPLR
jgi:hypothetical protein